MTTVALVGASGFVGKLTLRSLESAGHTVIPVRAPRVVRSEFLSPADMRGEYAELVDWLSRDLAGAEVVVNAAGDPDASSNDRPRLFGANALLPGLIGLACVKAHVARYIHVSSAAVQGRKPSLDDSEVTEPFSEYSRSKAAGETAALASAPTITTVYRPPSVHAFDRRVTRTLTKLATGPFSSVAGGARPTPQALGENVADAIRFLATSSQAPPAIVAHPSEGLTTSSLLRLLGGREPRSIPVRIARCALTTAQRLEFAHPSVAANARRAEMVWFGQGQAASWLTAAGWRAPFGHDRWADLGRLVREDLGLDLGAEHPGSETRPRKILFGVTTGIVVRSFFEGQFAMLRSAGWNVTLVTTDLGDARLVADREGATFVPVDAVRDPSPRHDLRTFRSLVQVLLRERPDLAVWGTPKFGLLGPIASRVTRVPSVYVLHGLRLQTATGAKKFMLTWFERVACRAADQVVAVSHDLRDEAIRLKLTSRSRIRVLGAGSANGVDFHPKRPEARRSMSLPTDGVLVAFVGRITQDKGIVELLRAWPQVHARTGATLALAGMREPDADRDPIRSLLTHTAGIKELGHLDDLGDLYSAMDLLVLPSYREGYPTVVLEAASYGAPAVVTNATGLRESVIDGKTGTVVEVGDVDALATALESLIADDHRRQQLGRAALANARRYDRKTVHENWLDYFTSRLS